MGWIIISQVGVAALAFINFPLSILQFVSGDYKLHITKEVGRGGLYVLLSYKHVLVLISASIGRGIDYLYNI